MKRDLDRSRAQFLELKAKQAKEPAGDEVAPATPGPFDPPRFGSVVPDLDEAEMAAAEARVIGTRTQLPRADERPPELAPRPPAPPRDTPDVAALQERYRRKAPAPTRAEKMATIWGRHAALEIFRHKKRVAFYRQLHKLVKAGIGLPVGFAELARRAPSASMRRSIESVAADVQQGEGLGAAMRRHAGRFDDVNVEVIALAEETGSLDLVLERIVDHLEKMQKLRWSIVISALWPLYLVVAVGAVGPALGLGGAILEGASLGDLPAIYARGLGTNLLVALAIVGTLFAWPFAMALFGVEQTWDRFKLRIPGIGRAFRSIYASRFYMTMGLATSSGVDVVKGLVLSLRSSGSAYLAGLVPATETRLRRGGTVADVVEAIDVFDTSDVGTIAVGERTGTLDEAFEELAEDHREAAVRGIRFLALAALGITAIVMIAIAIKLIFGVAMQRMRLIDDLLST